MEKIKAIVGNDGSNTLEVLSESTVFSARTHSHARNSEDLSDASHGMKSQHSGYQEELTVVIPLDENADWKEMSRETHQREAIGLSFNSGSMGEKTEYYHDVSPQGAVNNPCARSTNSNTLLVSAMPVIHLVMGLTSNNDFSDFDSVRSRLISEIDRFVNRSKQGTSDLPQIMAARYVVCSFIDESLATSEWDLAHRWGHESLLSYFHNETEGGRGFFQLLDRSLQQPHLHLDLLELIYVCLSLGFAGYYRMGHESNVKLESQREALMTTITAYRQPDNGALVLGDIKAHELGRSSKRWLAYALVGVLATCCVTGYLAASYSVDRQIEQISGRVS